MRFPLRTWSIFILSCLVLLSCRSGGGTTPPPGDQPGGLTVIVSPTGTLGGAGDSIEFAAEISYPVAGLSWDFGGGASPNISQERTPTVTLGAIGTYEGTLTLQHRYGELLRQKFVYRVVSPEFLAPHEIQVISDNFFACDNKTIAFEGQAEGVRPLTYDWEFGPEVTPRITTNSVARLHSTTPGVGTGKLVVRNRYGASTPMEFAYDIKDCPDASYEVVPSDDQTAQGLTAIRINYPEDYRREDQHYEPRVRVLTDYFSGVLRLSAGYDDRLQATVSLRNYEEWGVGDPAQIDLPSPHTQPLPVWREALALPSVAAGFYASSLSIMNDRMLVAFSDESAGFALRVAQATVNAPESSADWTVHTVTLDGISNDTRYLLREGPGFPSILVRDDQVLRLFVAQTMTPAQPADWKSLPINMPVPMGSTMARTTREDGRFVFAVSAPSTREVSLGHCLSPQPTSVDDIDVRTFFAHPELAQGVSGLVEWHDRLLLAVWYQYAYNFDLCLSNRVRPKSDQEWDRYTFELPGSLPGSSASLGSLGRTRNELWVTMNGTTTASGTFIATSTEPVPNNTSAWSVLGPIPYFYLGSGSRATVMMVADRPALLNVGVNSTVLRGMTARPNSMRDWYFAPLYPADQSTNVEFLPFGSLMADDDRIWVAYHDRASAAPTLHVLTTSLEW